LAGIAAAAAAAFFATYVAITTGRKKRDTTGTGNNASSSFLPDWVSGMKCFDRAHIMLNDTEVTDFGYPRACTGSPITHGIQFKKSAKTKCQFKKRLEGEKVKLNVKKTLF
jgi:hypothetical protein